MNSLFAAISEKNEYEFVCDVTDLNSLFINNEIAGDGMMAGSGEGACSFSRLHFRACTPAWLVLE